MKVIPETRRAN